MLMLDEPTNHLDAEAITRLANHLKSRWQRMRAASWSYRMTRFGSFGEIPYRYLEARPHRRTSRAATRYILQRVERAAAEAKRRGT